MEASVDSLRLAICLAIDLKNKNINLPLLDEVLNELSVKGNPVKNFGAAIKIISEKLDIYITGNHDDATGKDEYFRGMSIHSFMKHYARELGIYNSSNIEEVKKKHFGKSLSNIKEWSCGENGIIWISPIDELNSLFQKFSDSNLVATELCDMLGITPNTGTGKTINTELIIIRYPHPFIDHCAQPCILDTNWISTNGIYLSYKDFDGYGRTYSRSGNTSKSIKERVHNRIINKDYAFIAESIGLSNLFNIDQTNLLNEAINRFNN